MPRPLAASLLLIWVCSGLAAAQERSFTNRDLNRYSTEEERAGQQPQDGKAAKTEERERRIAALAHLLRHTFRTGGFLRQPRVERGVQHVAGRRLRVTAARRPSTLHA